MSGVSNAQMYSRANDHAFFAGRGIGKEGQNGESIKDIIDRIKDTDEMSTADKMDIISRRKQEIVEKVKRGETETSIPIGAQSFTMKQWNKMMRSVDKAIDDMQERIRKDKEKQERRIKKKRDGSITSDMLSELLGIDIKAEKLGKEGGIYYQITGEERFTQVSYADENDPEKSWSILFEEQSEENYNRVMEMMEEIIENGKDVRERAEWEKRMRR